MQNKAQNTEIERKFLVKGPFGHLVQKSTRIAQGYISADPFRTVRIRIKGEKGYITIKGISEGASRFEWEKEISLEDARQLLGLCEGAMIEKIRHLIPSEDGRHTWEVDEFLGENVGLIMAEIELESEDDEFPIPDWIGKEVTSDSRYYNSQLMSNPYNNWNKNK